MSDSICKQLPCSHLRKTITKLSLGRDPFQDPTNAFNLFLKDAKFEVGALVGGTMVDGISVVTVVLGFGIGDKDWSHTRIPHVQSLLETGISVQGHVPKPNNKFCGVNSLGSRLNLGCK